MFFFKLFFGDPFYGRKSQKEDTHSGSLSRVAVPPRSFHFRLPFPSPLLSVSLLQVGASCPAGATESSKAPALFGITPEGGSAAAAPASWFLARIDPDEDLRNDGEDASRWWFPRTRSFQSLASWIFLLPAHTGRKHDVEVTVRYASQLPKMRFHGPDESGHVRAEFDSARRNER